MGYLDELRAFISENPPDEPPTQPTQLPKKGHNAGSVGFVSDPMAHVRGKKLLVSWRSSVLALDPHNPHRGIEAKRWYEMVHCSHWWLEHFGGQAALDGWRTCDVFGIIPGEPFAGGLIDRLRSSRSLLMDGGRARWRYFGVQMKFNRGAYANLPAFWEAP